MNKPITVNVALTVSQINTLCEALKETRSYSDYSVERDSFVNDEGRYYSWSVSEAETKLAKRATLADLINLLSGEVITERPDTAQRIAAARVALDAQDAADKAGADKED